MAHQQLWLLRHGEAVPHESKADFDRELTARGQRQSVAAGAALARLGVEFDACYTSPLVRARGTARAGLRGARRRRRSRATSVGKGFDVDVVRELLAEHERRRARARSSATTRRSSRSCSTCAARASTSRRAAWPRSASPAACAASCSCCCARASSRRSRSSGALARQRRVDHRERDLGAARQRRLEHELARVVRLAAARPEPVDGERDRRRRGGSRRSRRRGARRRRAGRARRSPAASSGAVAASECIPGHSRISSGSSVTPPTSRGIASSTPMIAASVSARRSQVSSPRPGTTLNASPACSTVGTAVSRCGAVRARGRRRRPARRRRARAARCARGRAPSPSAPRGPWRAP